jgi:hypothetical protein
LFRDQKLLDLVTVERFSPETLSQGLIFFLFALAKVNALSSDDLQRLYTRFIVENEQEMYWRAYWDAVRQVIHNLEAPELRYAVFEQIRSTEWTRLYSVRDLSSSSSSMTLLLGQVIESIKDPAVPIQRWDFMPVIKTVRYLLEQLFENNFEDSPIRIQLQEVAGHVFSCYPMTGEARVELAQKLFQNASFAIKHPGVELQILRALLLSEVNDLVKNWDGRACLAELCRCTPSLPEVMLDEIIMWKKRQSDLGMEKVERPSQSQYRIQDLFNFLGMERQFTFPETVLERFWNEALVGRVEKEIQGAYWGGDLITESLRIYWFHTFGNVDFDRHPGFVCICDGFN